MNRSKVISSNIESIGYDQVSFVLEVEFKSGSIYQYLNVPVNIYHDFLNAPSAGKYLNQYIAFKYDYRNVDNLHKESHSAHQPRSELNKRLRPVSSSDVKKIYYRLAHKFHPDHDPAFEEMMKEINRLYSENDYRGLLFIAREHGIS